MMLLLRATLSVLICISDYLNRVFEWMNLFLLPHLNTLLRAICAVVKVSDLSCFVSGLS